MLKKIMNYLTRTLCASPDSAIAKAHEERDYLDMFEEDVNECWKYVNRATSLDKISQANKHINSLSDRYPEDQFKPKISELRHHLNITGKFN